MCTRHAHARKNQQKQVINIIYPFRRFYRTKRRNGIFLFTKTDSNIGIILDGVVANENGGFTPNEEIIAYDSYIMSAFGIGNYGSVNQTAANALFRNDWWKVREMALSYTFPKTMFAKTAFQNLTLSAFGRNLFYLYKAIPNYDPETSNGTDWKSQLVIGASASPTRTFGISLRANF